MKLGEKGAANTRTITVALFMVEKDTFQHFGIVYGIILMMGDDECYKSDMIQLEFQLKMCLCVSLFQRLYQVLKDRQPRIEALNKNGGKFIKEARVKFNFNLAFLNLITFYSNLFISL